MQPFTFLFQALAVYFGAQFVLAIVFRPMLKKGLTGNVGRAVVISGVNHVLLAALGWLGIRNNQVAAKINFVFPPWYVLLALIAGFILFVILDVGTRISKRKAGQLLFDLEEIALSPAFPKYISIPGQINYFLLKPLGEELFLRAFMV